MPRSEKERVISATIEGGGGGPITETLTVGNASTTFLAMGEGSYNIPVGQYEVRVYNTGLEDITVNGATVPMGESWGVEAIENRITGRFDLTPAVTVVVPADGAASYQYHSPSS